jgi:hypothetical protein
VQSDEVVGKIILLVHKEHVMDFPTFLLTLLVYLIKFSP